LGASSLLTYVEPARAARSLTQHVKVSGANTLSDVPYVMQGTDYSCGAASLQAVLSYWGTDLPEHVLMDRLHTSPRHGTHPEDITRVARELGFDATMEVELTIREIAASIEDGVPVIIAAQAWPEEPSADFSWTDDWEDGHYMVVIGVDGERIYLEDPALEGSRGAILLDEFDERWHNFLGDSPTAPGTVFVQHMGIFVTRR